MRKYAAFSVLVLTVVNACTLHAGNAVSPSIIGKKYRTTTEPSKYVFLEREIDGKPLIGFGDTGYYLSDCSIPEFVECLYSIEFEVVFATPSTPPTNKYWKTDEFDLFLVDDTQKGYFFDAIFDNGLLVFRYKYSAYDGITYFTWGKYKEDCERCLVPGVQYTVEN